MLERFVFHVYEFFISTLVTYSPVTSASLSEAISVSSALSRTMKSPINRPCARDKTSRDVSSCNLKNFHVLA